jgi:replicative DNA helicase
MIASDRRGRRRSTQDARHAYRHADFPAATALTTNARSICPASREVEARQLGSILTRNALVTSSVHRFHAISKAELAPQLPAHAENDEIAVETATFEMTSSLDIYHDQSPGSALTWIMSRARLSRQNHQGMRLNIFRAV